MISESSPLTSAPITPNEVTLMFSNGLALLEVVLSRGYKNIGMCAFKNCILVLGWRAIHYRMPSTEHTLLDIWIVNCYGFRKLNTVNISYNRMATVPLLYQIIGAKS